MKSALFKFENINFIVKKTKNGIRKNDFITKHLRTILVAGLMVANSFGSGCSEQDQIFMNSTPVPVASSNKSSLFRRFQLPHHLRLPPSSFMFDSSLDVKPLIKSEFNDSWAYSQMQTIPHANFSFTTTMRIDEPATKDYPIQQGESFVLYNNQENLGGYESALVMADSKSGERYRVMFSTKWQEVLLWSSQGGVLAVKPFPFQIGRQYRVLFAKQGTKLTVGVGSSTVITYFDQTVPLSIDSFGVATKEGKTQFGTISASALGSSGRPPRHSPNFSLKQWKDIYWGFDGDEPIFAILGRTAFATEVKLVPGYRAQLDIPWYMQNWVDEAFKTDKISNLAINAQGNQLKFTLTTKDEQGRTDLTNITEITVTYVSAKNVYQYDHKSQLIIPVGATLNVNYSIDVPDILYNQIVPSASPKGPQWPVTHSWSVYQHTDGNYYKQPINHVGWYPGYGTPEWWNRSMHYLKPDGGSWIIVGDPKANPLLQRLESPTRNEFSALMCIWGYDLHFSWYPGDGSPTTLSAGTYTINWRLTSLSGAEANARLASASFALPGDLTSKWLAYSGGVGNSESFDLAVLKASPFGEYVWGDSTFQDSTVGHGDSYSLKLEGPNFVGTTTGDSQFTEAFLPNTDYEVSVWIKTENVSGEGPGIFFSGNPYYPGITGTHDWQRIGFVARPSDPIHTVEFFLHQSGSGTVWMDDFLIRPITPETPVTPGLNNSSKPLSSIGSPSTEKLLELDTSHALSDPAKTILDSSGHANNAVRQNVDVVLRDGYNVFRFSGTDSQILMRGHESVAIDSPNSLVVWFNPSTGQNGWNVVASGGPREYDRWRIILNKTDAYYLYAQTATSLIGNSITPVPENQWSQLILVQDGSEALLYLNGQLLGSSAFSGSIFGSGRNGYVRLGAMSAGGTPDAFYQGDMGKIKILSKALSSSEADAEFRKGPFAP